MYVEAKQPIWKIERKQICLKIKSVIKKNHTNQNENAEA